MAVRPYVRTFDSNNYWHELASKEICLSIAWSSDYSVAQARAREDGTGARLAFTLPKEGSNITYNALLIPASAPHPQAAHRFLNFILQPRVIAAITNDTHYGNDNLAAAPFVDATSCTIRRSIRRPNCVRGCICRPNSVRNTTGCERGRGRTSRPASRARVLSYLSASSRMDGRCASNRGNAVWVVSHTTSKLMSKYPCAMRLRIPFMLCHGSSACRSRNSL